MTTADLRALRAGLSRQEETVIFSLLERARFKRNARIYAGGGIAVHGFSGSFLEYVLNETEAVHARAGRYLSTGELPFSDCLSYRPATESLGSRPPTSAANVNRDLLRHYLDEVVPAICEAGECENLFASALGDVVCLQAISRRVHHGALIADAKYASDPTVFDPILHPDHRSEIRRRLRDEAREAALLERVSGKATVYCREAFDGDRVAGIPPALIVALFRDWLIPATLDLEVSHLLSRARPESGGTPRAPRRDLSIRGPSRR